MQNGQKGRYFISEKNFQINNNFFVSVIVSLFVSLQFIDFQYLKYTGNKGNKNIYNLEHLSYCNYNLLLVKIFYIFKMKKVKYNYMGNFCFPCFFSKNFNRKLLKINELRGKQNKKIIVSPQIINFIIIGNFLFMGAYTRVGVIRASHKITINIVKFTQWHSDFYRFQFNFKNYKL